MALLLLKGTGSRLRTSLDTGARPVDDVPHYDRFQGSLRFYAAPYTGGARWKESHVEVCGLCC
jgi:hypothetical protein